MTTQSPNTSQHGERLARIEVQIERVEQDSQEIKDGLKELTQAIQTLATQAMTQVAELRTQVDSLRKANEDTQKRLRTIEDTETKRAGIYAVIATVGAFLAANWHKLLEAFK